MLITQKYLNEGDYLTGEWWLNKINLHRKDFLLNLPLDPINV